MNNVQVYFVGAGPGDPELITVKGQRLLSAADVVIYAGSLVNPALLAMTREDCEIHNSASMTLQEVIAVMENALAAGKTVVRLHTGDPLHIERIRREELSPRYVHLASLAPDTPGRDALIDAFSADALELGISELFERRELEASFDCMKKSRYCTDRGDIPYTVYRI